MRFLYQNQKNPCLLSPLSMQRKGSWSDRMTRRNTQLRKSSWTSCLSFTISQNSASCFVAFSQLVLWLLRHNWRAMKCLDSWRSSEGRQYQVLSGMYWYISSSGIYSLLYNDPLPTLFDPQGPEYWPFFFVFDCSVLFESAWVLNECANILNSVNWLNLIFTFIFI